MRPIYNIVSNSTSCTSLGPGSETTIITSSGRRQNNSNSPNMRSRSMNSSNNLPPRVRLSNDPNLDHLSFSPQSASSPYFSFSNNNNNKKVNRFSHMSNANNHSTSLINVSSQINNMPTTPNTPILNNYDNKYQFLFQTSSSPAYGSSSSKHKFLCDPHLDSPAITTISSNIDTTSLFSPSKIVKQQKQSNPHLSFKDRFNYPAQFFDDTNEMLSTSSNNKNIIDQHINFSDYKKLILTRNKYDLNNNNNINECYLKNNNYNVNGRQSTFGLFYFSLLVSLNFSSLSSLIIVIFKCIKMITN
jgi:hypothetical protein